MIALVSLISPFRSERDMARSRLAAGEFIEIHVTMPLSECERRDPKGLYRRARAGDCQALRASTSLTRRRRRRSS
jgi:bifunctional enzyme CysN/CysC